ncbi:MULTISPECIES: hypothetical protein [unclassified Amycolatopsis]|nr:hypothetical protein [Amycolatopsis sp. ATCC 39116]
MAALRDITCLHVADACRALSADAAPPTHHLAVIAAGQPAR